MNLIKHEKSGFIALFSVIIISFVLLLSAVTLNITSFNGRFNILDSESKKASNALADACIEQARLVLSIDSTFIGEDDVSVGTGACHYEIFAEGKIISEAIKNDAHTYYWADVDIADLDMPLLDFKECIDLSTCP